MTRKSMRTTATVGTALISLITLAACSNDAGSDAAGSANGAGNGGDDKLTIFATTG